MTAEATRRTVLQAGRRKAFRPLSSANRRAAFAAGIAAYERGDHFLAHELLEPAWMGTDDPIERALHQGLIKLAAAFVHAGRGNALGVAKNLAGARGHLATAVDDPRALGARLEMIGTDLDVAAIVADIDTRLAVLAASPEDPAIRPIDLPRSRPR